MYNIGINGIQVIVNNFIQDRKELKQIKFPKSKKKRIRKKWSKRKENFKEIIVGEAIQIGDKVYINQRNFNKLKEQLKNHPRIKTLQ